jgi:hypothetical protein
MTTWTNQDTIKLILLLLFILSFVVAIQQLFQAQARLDDNTARRKEEALMEKKDS